MTTPSETLRALRASTTALLDGVAAERWTDADARAASLLPDWTRGHVLTHLARNADGIALTLTGALHGERLPRYPGGREGRDADIAAGAGRPLEELVADVDDSAARLDQVLTTVSDADGWQLQCDDRTAGEYLVGRWREVEIHRVDLGGTYTADQWPAAFVTAVLPDVIGGLVGRTQTGLRITVTEDGSALSGTSWSVGVGDRAEVSGPAWALLAWAVGRSGAARGILSEVPDLSAWR